MSYIYIYIYIYREGNGLRPTSSEGSPQKGELNLVKDKFYFFKIVSFERWGQK